MCVCVCVCVRVRVCVRVCEHPSNSQTKKDCNNLDVKLNNLSYILSLRQRSAFINCLIHFPKLYHLLSLIDKVVIVLIRYRLTPANQKLEGGISLTNKKLHHSYALSDILYIPTFFDLLLKRINCLRIYIHFKK